MRIAALAAKEKVFPALTGYCFGKRSEDPYEKMGANTFECILKDHGTQVWKPATQQAWKPALHERPGYESGMGCPPERKNRTSRPGDG
jgi:hypothetical protein